MSIWRWSRCCTGLKRDDRIYLLDAIDPDRPLLHWRLMQVMPPESPEAFGSVHYRAMLPSFDVLSVLFGRTELSPSLATYVELRTAQARLDDLCLDAALRSRIESCARQWRQPASRACPPRADGCPGSSCGARAEWASARLPPEPPPTPVAQCCCSTPGRPVIWRAWKRCCGACSARPSCGEPCCMSARCPILLVDQGRAFVRRFESHPSAVFFGLETMQPPRLKIHRPLQELELSLPSEPTRLFAVGSTVPKANRAADVQLVAGAGL